MATISVTVCDECRDPGRSTRSYRITSEGRTITRDLCEEHAAPIEAMFTEIPKPAKEPKRRGRPSTMRVTTMEEIEQIKAAQDASSARTSQR